MGLNLTKGQKIDLSKGASTKRFYIGLGWDTPQQPGSTPYDLDVSAALLSAGLLTNDANFVFYNQLSSVNGEVVHSGDNLTGAGDGDDESLVIDLDKMDASLDEVSILVTIHEAQSRSQNFGGVKNAFIRVCENDQNGTELMRFDLEEDYSLFTGVQFGSIYKKDGEWKFNAVGNGFKNDLGSLIDAYKTTATA